MASPSRATAAGWAFHELRKLAKSQGRSTDELLVLYVLERFLCRLSRSPHRERLILKGGLLLAVLDARRTTRDVDLLARCLDRDVDSVLQLIAEIALAELDDGVLYEPESARTAPIREDDLYAGVRVVMPSTVGRARVKLALDINFGDPVTPGVVITRFPQLLDAESFPVLGYPIETVLAEKITTMVVLGDLNTRDRDWADVWRLTRIHDVVGLDLEAALQRTARHRDVSLRPLSEIVDGLRHLRQTSYAVWRTRQSVDSTLYPPAFSDVVDQVVAFADQPIAGRSGGRTWSAAESIWR